MDIGNFMKQSSYKEGKDWFEPVLNTLTPHPPHWSSQFFLIAPLRLRSQKKKFFGKKNIEWHLLLLALTIRPMHASSYVRFGVFTAMNKNSY
jgi:hypothetical protein